MWQEWRSLFILMILCAGSSLNLGVWCDWQQTIIFNHVVPTMERSRIFSLGSNSRGLQGSRTRTGIWACRRTRTNLSKIAVVHYSWQPLVGEIGLGRAEAGGPFGTDMVIPVLLSLSSVMKYAISKSHIREAC
jgi:hypothetical protein